MRGPTLSGPSSYFRGPLGEVVFHIGLVLLAGAVLMTLLSGYEFFRDVWKQ